MSDPFVLVVAGVLGAVIGSFLNAVIYRLPRRHEQSMPARSICPACRAPIPAYWNVPILGWLALRGRAACCGARIHWQYPLVEALTAAMFVALAWSPPSGLPLRGDAFSGLALAAFGFHAYFVANLIANTFIDFEFRILPDRLTKPLVYVGVVAAFVVPGLPGAIGGTRIAPELSSVLASLFGFAVGYGLTWLVRRGASSVFGKEAMGFGDVKLMGGVGAFLGWQGALLTFFIGCLSGALIGVIHKWMTRDSYIAFGPFLVLGALLTLFLRDPILEFLTVTWPEWQREHMASPFALVGIAVVCLFLLFVLVRKGRNP